MNAALVERAIEGMGFNVVLIEESIGKDGVLLKVRIEHQGDSTRGRLVTISDCAFVTRGLREVLEEEGDSWVLEVSSPGLDRPLRHLDDCRRFVGRLATIITTEAVDGQRHLAGRITGVERERVVIATDRQRIHRIPWLLVARARLDVEF